jgi:hypothetical protein
LLLKSVTQLASMINAFYDYFDTILESLFETFYIFMWIIYVNNYVFKYNQRINDLEVETVGLRRMVYAFLDEKTKTNHFSSRNSAIGPLKKNDAILSERMNKLKKMMLSLRDEMDELKSRVDDLEDEDYEPTSHEDDEDEEGECETD